MLIDGELALDFGKGGRRVLGKLDGRSKSSHLELTRELLLFAQPP